MKILIVTGIYPPEIGGPAEYVKNLEEVWKKLGYAVSVRVFSRFMKFPWGIRHILFFFYVLPKVVTSDVVFTFEAFSSGLVAVASKIFNKKVIFRTGGDLLWESYIERTGDMVLLKDFYNTRLDKLSIKEKLIFYLMRWTLRNISAVIWSTEFQKEIFLKPYGLDRQNQFLVENYYGPKNKEGSFADKIFVASSRNIKLKNLNVLMEIFSEKELIDGGFVLDTNPIPYIDHIKKIRDSYAVLVVSISEISPNAIIDALRENKPFIVTREVGIYDRIKDVALFVDPKDKQDIADKVLWLCDSKNYELQKSKVKSFNFIHSWEEIAEEYINIYNKIK